MPRPMLLTKRKTLLALLVLGCVLQCNLALAQLGLSRTIRDVTDRQADRSLNQAADRALQQAETAVSRAAERAQQQVEATQSRAAERVQAVQTNQIQSQVTERGNTAVRAVGVEVAGAAAAAGQIQNSTNAQAIAEGLTDAANAAVLPLRQVVFDRNGNPAFVEVALADNARAIEFEWVMMVTPAQRQQLNNEARQLLNFLTESRPFGLAQGELLTFHVPPDLDANDNILQLVPVNLRDQIDRNHVYATQTSEQSLIEQQATLLSLPMATACKAPVAIGMIDSAIDEQHEAFVQRRRIHSRSFVDAALVQTVSHGTAVAAMLVGKHEDRHDRASSLHPLLPNAALYSAAVFHANEGEQQGATVMRVLAALDWLIGRDDIRVINMSLAGPPNRLLAQAVAVATQRGKVIVAAAGNEGPNGAARYPAAYEDVIAVSAVGRDRSIYRWSNQGPQIDYVALGVAVPTALHEGGFGPQSGTSIAAPIVSALLACALDQHKDVAKAFKALDARVQDLGAPGKDVVFGKGLLQP